MQFFILTLIYALEFSNKMQVIVHTSELMSLTEAFLYLTVVACHGSVYLAPPVRKKRRRSWSIRCLVGDKERTVKGCVARGGQGRG